MFRARPKRPTSRSPSSSTGPAPPILRPASDFSTICSILLLSPGLIDLDLAANGDLHIDFHHTVEDSGLALGQAVRRALGDLAGITRYADVHLPMDETLTRVAVDVSGRPFLVFKTTFHRAKIGEFDTALVREFFQAFAMSAGMTIHVETLYGVNDHHIAKSFFKALARALKQAISIDPRQQDRVPSTKGTLTD